MDDVITSRNHITSLLIDERLNDSFYNNPTEFTTDSIVNNNTQSFKRKTSDNGVVHFGSAKRIKKPSAGKQYPYAKYIYNIEKYEDSRSVRSIMPYIHEYCTFAKGRWLGREILEVLTRNDLTLSYMKLYVKVNIIILDEFGSHPLKYWEDALALGHVRVNKKIIPKTYKFRNGDALLHKTHR